MVKCTPCEAGAPKLTEHNIADALKKVDSAWRVTEEEGVKKLERTFAFRAYAETIRFVNAIADSAEQQGHHPVMIVAFRTLTLYWWTHKIGGLHANDFIMAAESDRIYETHLPAG